MDGDLSCLAVRVTRWIGDPDVGKIVVVDGILASSSWGAGLATPAAPDEVSYYFGSAVSMGLGVAGDDRRFCSARGHGWCPPSPWRRFCFLLNTSPSIRPGEFGRFPHFVHRIAVNIFMFHLLGDVPSPTSWDMLPTAIRFKPPSSFGHRHGGFRLPYCLRHALLLRSTNAG